MPLATPNARDTAAPWRLGPMPSRHRPTPAWGPLSPPGRDSPVEKGTAPSPRREAPSWVLAPSPSRGVPSWVVVVYTPSRRIEGPVPQPIPG